MNESDPAGYAELWLSELGAPVPEHHAADPVPQGREVLYGMHLTEPARARRHSSRLRDERPVPAPVRRGRRA